MFCSPKPKIRNGQVHREDRLRQVVARLQDLPEPNSFHLFGRMCSAPSMLAIRGGRESLPLLVLALVHATHLWKRRHLARQTNMTYRVKLATWSRWPSWHSCVTSCHLLRKSVLKSRPRGRPMTKHRWSTCCGSRHNRSDRLRIATGIQVVSSEAHGMAGRRRQSLPKLW